VQQGRVETPEIPLIRQHQIRLETRRHAMCRDLLKVATGVLSGRIKLGIPNAGCLSDSRLARS
jgi:hypothetical protein